MGVAIYGVTELYPIAKEIASNVCPSEELKAQRAANLEQAEQRLAVLRAEKKFRQCVLNNQRDSERGPLGLPVVCEDAINAMALFGRYDDVEKAATFFKKYGN